MYTLSCSSSDTTDCNGVTSWDASVNKDGSIMSYIIDDGLGTNIYKLYIQGDGFIYVNPNMSNWFRFATSMYPYTSKLKNINNLNLLDTSKVTDMSYMFLSCIALKNLTIYNAVFTSITVRSSMFNSITSGINIIVKDADAQTFINRRLTEGKRTGNVTVFVP